MHCQRGDTPSHLPEPLGRGQLLQSRLTAFNPLIGYQTCVVQIRADGLPAGRKPAPFRARGSIPSTTHQLQVRSSKAEHVALNHSVRVRFSPDLPSLGCALACRDALQATRAEFDSQAVHRTHGRLYADAGDVTGLNLFVNAKQPSATALNRVLASASLATNASLMRV